VEEKSEEISEKFESLGESMSKIDGQNKAGY
jgi:hypothetical protein